MKLLDLAVPLLVRNVPDFIDFNDGQQVEDGVVAMTLNSKWLVFFVQSFTEQLAAFTENMCTA